MAHLGSLILAASLLTGCGQDPKIQKEIISVDLSPKEPIVSTVTLEPPPVLYLCITGSPEGWPVGQIMNAWNVNGKNQFTLDLTKKCRDKISFKLVVSEVYEGETEFFKGEGIEVRLDKRSSLKLHVLCHELGHVLGLPHNQDPTSCMNINKTVTTPSTLDIENAGRMYWIKEQSARHATGQ